MNETSEPQRPEWAVSFARSALRTGMHVLEIEQHLISKGLSPDDANGIVMDIVEAAFAKSAESPRSSEWGKPVRLSLSAALAGACLLLAYWQGGRRSIGYALLWVVPELIGIWVPELMDLEGVDWAIKAWISGWVLLLIYLAYQIFVLVMWT